jgi:hypothetical protein
LRIRNSRMKKIKRIFKWISGMKIIWIQMHIYLVGKKEGVW